MAEKTLPQLLEVRDNLARQLDLHAVRGKALEKKYHQVLRELQAACPHEDQVKSTTYTEGGYDYCATTRVVYTCKTCGAILNVIEETHHGRYG